jgi:Nuclease subunit of the excinuclease complex
VGDRPFFLFLNKGRSIFWNKSKRAIAFWGYGKGDRSFWRWEGRSCCRIKKLPILPLLCLNPSSKKLKPYCLVPHPLPFRIVLPFLKNFALLPMRAGIYAVKHRTLGILYIGKTRTLRDRFRGGHKALLWAFIEELKATDIRIAFYQLDFTQWIQLSSELESLIIQAINPPYNVKIPARD